MESRSQFYAEVKHDCTLFDRCSYGLSIGCHFNVPIYYALCEPPFTLSPRVDFIILDRYMPTLSVETSVLINRLKLIKKNDFFDSLKSIPSYRRPCHNSNSMVKSVSMFVDFIRQRAMSLCITSANELAKYLLLTNPAPLMLVKILTVDYLVTSILEYEFGLSLLFSRQCKNMSDLYILLPYICYDKIIIMFCLNCIFLKFGYPRVGDWCVSAATINNGG